MITFEYVDGKLTATKTLPEVVNRTISSVEIYDGFTSQP